MMYDASGLGAKYRTLTFNGLAWWHTYKAACNKLWQLYAKEFFAPLFHAIDPNGWFFMKQKYLSKIVQLFTLIRLAYPRFRAALQEAIRDRHVTPASKQHLDNLHTLCEFLIPVVIIPYMYIYQLKIYFCDLHTYKFLISISFYTMD